MSKMTKMITMMRPPFIRLKRCSRVVQLSLPHPHPHRQVQRQIQWRQLIQQHQHQQLFRSIHSESTAPSSNRVPSFSDNNKKSDTPPPDDSQHINKSNNNSNNNHSNKHNSNRRSGHDSHTILGYIALCCILAGGTMFFTSDTFLKWMIETIVSLAKRLSSSSSNGTAGDDGPDWDLKFDRVSGCFFCGSVKFENLTFSKTIVKNGDGGGDDDNSGYTKGSNVKRIVKIQFSADQMVGVVAFDNFVKQVVKQWFRSTTVSSLFGTSGDGGGESTEERETLILIPKLGIIGARMTVDVNWIPEDIDLSKRLLLQEQRSNNLRADTNNGAIGNHSASSSRRSHGKQQKEFHFHFGDLRIFDSVCHVHLNSVGDQMIRDTTVLKVKSYESLEPFSTRDWLFNVAFRSMMDAELNGSPFSTSLIVADHDRDKDLITDYFVQWKLSRYPIEKLISFQTALETGQRQIRVPLSLSNLITSPFIASRYISLQVESRESQSTIQQQQQTAAAQQHANVNMKFNVDIVNEVVGKTSSSNSTDEPVAQLKFHVAVPKRYFEGDRELKFLSLLTLNILRSVGSSSTLKKLSWTAWKQKLDVGSAKKDT